MNKHMEAAIKASARAIHDLDPDQSYGEEFEECCAKEWEMRDARAAISAALPHIRAMIAQEISSARHDDATWGASVNRYYDSGYTDIPDQYDQLFWDAGMGEAARIAEVTRELD